MEEVSVQAESKQDVCLQQAFFAFGLLFYIFIYIKNTFPVAKPTQETKSGSYGASPKETDETRRHSLWFLLLWLISVVHERTIIKAAAHRKRIPDNKHPS